MAPPVLDQEYLFSTSFSPRIKRILACKKYSRCNIGICGSCYFRKSMSHRYKVQNILKVTDEIDKLLPDPVHLYRAVLTQRERDGTLRKRFEKLYDHLAAFTHHRGLVRSKYLLGGVWRLHVGYNANEQTWNPHIDTLIESRQMPMGTIEQEWRRVGGGIANVQTVTRSDLSFERLTKYIFTVPFKDFEVRDVDSAHRNATVLETYAEAIGRRRKIAFLGTWRQKPKART